MSLEHVMVCNAVHEYVGLERNSKEFGPLVTRISQLVGRYAEGKQLLDGYASTQLKQMQRLGDALSELEAACAGLDAGARLVLEEAPDAKVSLQAITECAQRLRPAIEAGLTTLRFAALGDPQRHRPTQSARNFILVDLSCAFQAHYKLASQDYKLNLLDFLVEVLDENEIPHPTRPDDLWALVPEQFQSPSQAPQ